MKLIYTITAVLLMLQAGATIRYVRAGAPAGGNGLSWATAYNNLETALNSAVVNTDQIWVSAGTYSPTTSGSFTIKSGVQVFGGFPATGSPTMSDTNWRSNRTYLVKATPNNSIVVMNSVNTANVLNGFYIKKGNTTDGGGLYMTGSGTTASRPTIQNIVFDSCVATIHGGGIQVVNAHPLIINVIFQNCRAAYGGGISTEDAAPDMRRCAFEKDSATTDGGAIYYNGTPASGQHGVFTDVVAYNSWAGRAAGGAALQGDGSMPRFVNCTFVNNYSVQSLNSTGGAIYTYSATTTNAPKPIITNCLFFGNRNSQRLLDVGAQLATNKVTYSYFSTATSSDTGSVLSNGVSPFTNLSLPKGADGEWLTADDGLMPAAGCTGKMVIDKGNNDSITYAVDAAFQTRKRDVAFIKDGGAGTAPVVDMGAYENQNATTIAQIAGVIQGNDTVPSPQQMPIDTIRSISPPKTSTGSIIQWQSKVGSGNWQPAAGTNNGVNYYFTTLSQTTSFRRATYFPQEFCDTLYSNEMQVFLYGPATGRIKGQITSRSGSGVEGVSVRIRRRGSNTPGSPAGYTTTVPTNSSGIFTLTQVYYGPNVNSIDSFWVVPVLAGHKFQRNDLDRADSISVVLRAGDDQFDNNNFTDITVFSLTGKTVQRCLGCIDTITRNVVNTLTCPLEGVKVLRGTADSSYSYISNNDAVYGLSISNTGTYTIRPRYKNHSFVPDSLSVVVNTDVINQNFTDTSTRLIYGKVTAGCEDTIGTTVLEFSDIPQNSDGTTRSSCFVKRDTTDSRGNYDIRLPAGKYKVKVIKLTPSIPSNQLGYVSSDQLITFINDKLPSDSLIRDVSTGNALLNLVYQRPPVLVITKGLDTFCSPGVSRHYALMKQAIDDSFQVKIFQGSPLLRNGRGCQLRDTTNPIIVTTSIQQKDLSTEELSLSNMDTSILVRLTPGTPYTIAPFYKPLSIRYTDNYGRIAQPISRDVVVTGVKPDAGATFTTVSPQIPLMVLHDPPGDQSFSTWATTQKRELAFRMYAEAGGSVKIWREIKLGTKQEVEIFGVGTEFEVWGKVKNAFTFEAAAKTGTELLLSSSVTNEYNTSANPSVTGADGDLFIGTALNLICIGSDVLTYNGCGVKKTRELIVSNNGFAPNTDYIYSQLQIQSNIIPSLQRLAEAKPDSAAYFRNQVSVWQQLLENNRRNKQNARFDKNISFGGSSGLIRSSTSSSVSNTNTVEFKMGLSYDLATDIGFDIGGSGTSGGVDINVKVEMGISAEGSVTREETMGYTLGDQNILDIFNVNVKKDPVYSTPVFELIGGETSCPVEPGSYPRDQFEIYAPVNTIEGVPANGTATFTLKMANTNVHESRYYYLTFENVSNPNGATVTGPFGANNYFIIPPASEAQAIINVSRPVNSNVYDFNDLQFSINDSCYRVSKTVSLNARFQSPCSGITIGAPDNNWVVTSANNNILPILLKDYTKYALTSIRLEYAAANSSNWILGFTKTAAELNSDSTTIYWNVSGLPEGAYKIRVALNCSQGTNYTTSVMGIIDRKAPELFGRPEPTNSQYVRGDQISYSYNEKLDISNLNNGRVTLDKRSNNQFVPVGISVSGYENKIIITPAVAIANTPGDTMRVVVRSMTDVYGNIKVQPDTSFFIVGNSPISTANNAMIVAITNPTISKTSDSIITVAFRLPVNTARNVRVNYTISGTARYGIDYTTEYVTPQPSFAFFNGVQGSAQIDSTTSQVLLRIRSIDTSFNANKTIIINLSEGGDYNFGANTSVTGTLLNEDGISAYTFTGNGNFNVRSNWVNNRMPLTTLTSGKSIFINPTGNCTLNVPLTIRPGATLRVLQNKLFVIPGFLKLN